MYYLVLELPTEEEHEARKWSESIADTQQLEIAGLYRQFSVMHDTEGNFFANLGYVA